jgi:hypothetical protein
MRNEVFVYLEIYSVYLEIYEYGKVVQGVRLPDDDVYRYVLHLESPYLEISWYIPGISQGYDHLCRKTGIYQVYTCHMKTIFISQVYTWYIPLPCFSK